MPRISSDVRPSGRALALSIGLGLIAASTVRAQDAAYATPQPCARGCTLRHSHVASILGGGSLGYAPAGVYPGFQGFGLGFPKGYGYGGLGLGTGGEGGYPFYGGPGYPHPAPRLRRIGGINPFPYFGGPGGPTPSCPNYYGEPGGLVPDAPVVKIIGGAPEDHYGALTGMIPYPDSTFASATTAASGETATVTPPTNVPPPPAVPTP